MAYDGDITIRRKIVAMTIGVLCGVVAAAIVGQLIPASSDTQYKVLGAIKIITFVAVAGLVDNRIRKARR